MSEFYFNEPDNRVSTDGFGRLQISSPVTEFDSKQVTNNDSRHMSEVTVGGASSISYVNAEASSDIVCGTGASDHAIRQTRARFQYQSGKALRILMTGCLTQGTAGTVQNMGYMDDTDGIFLQNNNGTVNIVFRTNVTGSPVETVLNQDSWNCNAFKNIDFTKSVLFYTDLQWLGTGDIIVGLYVEGRAIPAHCFRGGNYTSVSLANPNLHVRWESKATGANDGTGEIKAICCTVMTEDGPGRKFFHPYSADNFATPLGPISAGAMYNAITIRKGAGVLRRAVVVPSQIDIVSLSNSIAHWTLRTNATVAGAPSFAAVDAKSAVEFDIAGTTVTLGDNVLSGFIEAKGQITLDLPSFETIGEEYGGASDELTLTIEKIGGGSDTFYAAVSWHEAI